MSAGFLFLTEETSSMKKIAFGVLVAAAAGCATGGPAHDENVGAADQALSAPVPVPRPAPRRKVSSSGPSGGGVASGGSAATPGWHPLVNQPQTFYPGTSL